jgi:hypothetical protein
MRVPFHAVRLWSDAPRPSAPRAALERALDGPLVRLEVVPDVLGLPLGYDLVVQDGAYLLALALAAWLALRARLRRRGR